MSKWCVQKVIAPIVLCLSLSLSATSVLGTTYYVSAAGSDGADGTSPAEPWQTLAKVSGATFAPGDTIKFQGGDIFRGSLTISTDGSSAGRIVYTSYGTGRAKLYGSVSKGSSSDWTQIGTNWWASTIAGYPDHGAVWFNGGTAVSMKVAMKDSLLSQGRHWSDKDSSRVWLYSVGNPASVYTGLEVALDDDIIAGNGKDYITISNLELAYGGAHGYNSSAIDFVTIEDCYLHHIGGSYVSGTTRYGNGVQFIQSANHCIARRNIITECYDAGVTWQNPSGTSTANDILFENNLIGNCEYLVEIFNSVAGCHMDSIRVVHNTCCNSGGQRWHSQRPVTNNSNHLMFSENAGTAGNLTNLIVRNNIFSGNEAASNLMYVASWNDTSVVTFDRNLWYGTSFCMWLGAYKGTFDAWKTDTGKGATDLSGDPQFVNASAGNYRVPLGSPARLVGAGGPGTETDLDGNRRCWWDWSLGAYDLAGMREYPIFRIGRE